MDTRFAGQKKRVPEDGKPKAAARKGKVSDTAERDMGSDAYHGDVVHKMRKAYRKGGPEVD